MNIINDVSTIQQHDEQLDFNITKRHFPRVLEFIFEKDPNTFMRKNKIVIRGAIELDANVIPDNGFVAKLFSMVTVEVDSQSVSNNRNK